MGRTRNSAIMFLATALLCALAMAFVLRPGPATATAQAQRGGSLVGVASCGGTTCHGRSEADGKIVRQDELMIWQDEASPSGAHSRAWRVLAEPRSRAIAQRLGIGEATSAPMCLGCHATPAAAGARGPRFQTSDGVGCEGCHGAASAWLASHYAVGASHAANVARGMVPLDNPKARASVCLDCHFGSSDAGQFVNHRIMAAGHPRISFELDLFSTLQQHHDEDGDYASRKRRTSNVQMWAIGQAMALDRALTLFAGARGSDGLFPEFYFFDCHTCHRPISDDPRFEPTALANPGRPIPQGMPAFNDENMIMLSAAARVVVPAQAARFDRDSRAFHNTIAKDRASAIAAAAALRESARALASAFAGAPMGRDQTFAIIDAITSNAVSERFTDYAGSVQAVMATDTLLSALVNAGDVQTASAETIRADINSAYQAVRDPNAYRPREFRASLGRAAAAIGKLR
ncbi:multiheme c-type cytochrome [Sphingomonas sp. LY54]|uniref:multiheme c-type cytochrome n=1 Tax=Sphingomonas sp. LY54 TaxID=3095343 RepID=UPI002D78A44D|nr:multiheme c-type cytochrome [Sphingomonas sp. LY54]WRP28429.1 multiheme c-type cytochrome [Sphingomonas sp. LY54]